MPGEKHTQLTSEQIETLRPLVSEFVKKGGDRLSCPNCGNDLKVDPYRGFPRKGT